MRGVSTWNFDVNALKASAASLADGEGPADLPSIPEYSGASSDAKQGSCVCSACNIVCDWGSSKITVGVIQ